MLCQFLLAVMISSDQSTAIHHFSPQLLFPFLLAICDFFSLNFSPILFWWISIHILGIYPILGSLSFLSSRMISFTKLGNISSYLNCFTVLYIFYFLLLELLWYKFYNICYCSITRFYSIYFLCIVKLNGSYWFNFKFTDSFLSYLHFCYDIIQ